MSPCSAYNAHCINSIKKKKKKKAEIPEKEENVKFADYKEPVEDQEPVQDTRTPAELAYEKAQQKRVCVISTLYYFKIHFYHNSIILT